jgi:hypothetical protein
MASVLADHTMRLLLIWISATRAKAGGALGRQKERQLLSAGVPAPAGSLGLSVRHLGRRPSTLPRNLEDPQTWLRLTDFRRSATRVG